MSRVLNSDDDFEIINGEKVLKDGRTLRVHQTMMDSKTRPAWISDGSGNPLANCRPGFRRHTAADKHQNLQAAKAADYDAYDAEISQAWRTPETPVGNAVNAVFGGTWTNDAWSGPNLQRAMQEEDDDETDDDDDDEEGEAEELGSGLEAFRQGAIEEAFRGTQTATESTVRRDVPDRLARDHEKRMRQLRPQLRQWATDKHQIVGLQKAREKVMDRAYDDYDAQLKGAWRR